MSMLTAETINNIGLSNNRDQDLSPFGARLAECDKCCQPLYDRLMQKVACKENLLDAYKQMRKKGSPGIDQMTVEQLKVWLDSNMEVLINELLQGSYQPSKIRRALIPKEDGSKRKLGIPTVKDRLIQSAIVRVLDPIFDPTFSESSYGFRPGRNQHQAVLRCKEHIQDGYCCIVDIDLSKFFDNANHGMIMNGLSRMISDRGLMELIRRFLTKGVMQERKQDHKGAPQGGPLSPLLCNILLDVYDKEMERRGHRFVRYADDILIFTRSRRAAERIMQSSTHFLEQRMKLQVNLGKSRITHPCKVSYLGFKFTRTGKVGINKKSEQRIYKKTNEELIGRGQDNKIVELQKKGRLNYFSIANKTKRWKLLNDRLTRITTSLLQPQQSS